MNPVPFSGKTVLVTGASRGLGRHLAEAFWAAGADLFLVSRSAPQPLPPAAAPAQRSTHLAIDLGAAEAPARIFEALLPFSPTLDVVVNNAAIVGPMGPLEENDWSQWEAAIRVNLLAPIALCRLALARMKAQGRGVILNLSGGGATSPRPFFSAYATAKAGLVRFTETLAAEAGPHGIRAHAIAPGAMNTEMHQQVLRAGPALAGETEYRRAVEQAQRGGVPPSTAAELAVFLASDAAAAINGRLISAVWDSWKNLAAHAAELAASDVYTLRRIVPRERGFRWE